MDRYLHLLLSRRDPLEPFEDSHNPLSKAPDLVQSLAFRDLAAKAKQLQTALRHLGKLRSKGNIHAFLSEEALAYPAGADEQTLFAISNEGTAAQDNRSK